MLRSIGVASADKLEVETGANGVLHLHGWLERWSDFVAVGHALAEHPAIGDFASHVMTGDGPSRSVRRITKTLPPTGTIPAASDAVVVGGGMIGLAVARALIRAGLRPLVLEAGLAIAAETSTWNNGMIHSGFDPACGTLKATLNVRGNALWPELARELDVPMLRNGSLVIGRDDEETQAVVESFNRAVANGVPGAELIDKRRTLAIAPDVAPTTRCALWTPSAGFIDPVLSAHAMAEDVRANEGTIVLSAPVTAVAVAGGAVCAVETPTASVETRILVNAAGVRADEIAAMAGCQSYSIHPRRGTLVFFEADAGPSTRPAVGFPSHRYTKGGGMTPRPAGQTVGGPTAIDQPSRDAPTPSADEVDEILTRGRALLPGFPLGTVVSIGSGLRPATFSEDFAIGPAPGVTGFFDVAGTQSPGVASVPAITERVVGQIRAAGLWPEITTAAPFVTRAERRGRRPPPG